MARTPRRSMRRPRRRRRTATQCPGDEVGHLTPDAYRVGMLIALSKSPSGDPLTEAQRAEVELFMARVLDRADTDDDRATLRSIFETIATATMPAAWHALGTGCSASTTFAARVASFKDVTRHPQNDRTRCLGPIASRRHPRPGTGRPEVHPGPEARRGTRRAPIPSPTVRRVS